MKGKERNAFEKELQKDPFDAEAADGLSLVTPKEAEEDLHTISERLKKRSKRKIAVNFLRIAAVVTLLLATTLTLMIVRSDHKLPLVSENIKPESKKEELTIHTASPVSRVVTPSTDQKAEQIKPQEKGINGVGSIAPVVFDSLSEKGVVVNEEIAALNDQKLSNFRLMEVMDSREKAMAAEKKHKRVIEGTVISTDDNLPIPGASIVIKGTNTGVVSDINGKFSIAVNTDSSLMLVAKFVGMKSKEFSAKPDSNLLVAMNADMLALDEVVVVGYGVQKSQNVTGSVATIKSDEEKNQYDYTPPEPVTGNTSFKSYIESNLHYPADITKKTREVVIISMTVLRDGTKTNMRILKSPSQAFSDEALRLINEGPDWKPATLNGTPQDEEVKVRIVFK